MAREGHCIVSPPAPCHPAEAKPRAGITPQFNAMSKEYFVYILSNRPRGVLYTGVTDDLGRRVASHKAGGGSKFTYKYNARTLVYFEAFGEISDAIARENA